MWSTGSALVWRVACDAFLQVRAGSSKGAKEAPRHPKGMVGDDRKRGVVSMLCQAQQRVPELSCRVQLWLCIIIPPKANQDRDQLLRLAHPLTQRTCLRVGVLHLGCR